MIYFAMSEVLQTIVGRPLQPGRIPSLAFCSQVKLDNDDVGAFLAVHPAYSMQPPLCVFCLHQEKPPCILNRPGNSIELSLQARMYISSIVVDMHKGNVLTDP